MPWINRILLRKYHVSVVISLVARRIRKSERNANSFRLADLTESCALEIPELKASKKWLERVVAYLLLGIRSG